jgi:hypothetical protein
MIEEIVNDVIAIFNMGKSDRDKVSQTIEQGVVLSPVNRDDWMIYYRQVLIQAGSTFSAYGVDFFNFNKFVVSCFLLPGLPSGVISKAAVVGTGLKRIVVEIAPFPDTIQVNDIDLHSYNGIVKLTGMLSNTLSQDEMMELLGTCGSLLASALTCNDKAVLDGC